MKIINRASLCSLAVIAGVLCAPVAAARTPAGELSVLRALKGPVSDPAGEADPDVASSRGVAVDVELLRTADASADVSFDVPLGDGVSVTASVERLVLHEGGRFSVTGRLDDHPYSSFVLAGGELGLCGDFRAVTHGVHQLRLSQSGGQVLRRVEQTTEPPRCGNTQATEELVAQLAQQAVQGQGPQVQGAPPPSHAVDLGVQIDILLAFTPLAESQSSLVGFPIHMLILAAVADVNASLSNSAIPLNYRLVHMHGLNTNATNDFSQNLTDLRGKTDGKWDEVHALRDLYAADIVHMVLNNAGGVGGLAYRPSSQSQLDPVTTDYAYGFSLWSQVATGTLAHELGHNMGCHHHPDDEDAGSGAVAGTQPVIYPYAFGHRGGSPGNNGFTTIMAYATSGYTPIAYFSNPLLTTPWPGATWSLGLFGQRDNALVIHNTRDELAAYRPSVHYVDEDAMGTTTGSQSQPWASLGHAITVAPAGHSVRLLDDDSMTGVIDDYVVLESAAGAGPVVIGQ